MTDYFCFNRNEESDMIDSYPMESEENNVNGCWALFFRIC